MEEKQWERVRNGDSAGSPWRSRSGEKHRGATLIEPTQPRDILPVTDRLEYWRNGGFVAQRRRGSPSRIARRSGVSRIGAALAGRLRRALVGERPIAILSGNSVEHLLLALAAMHAALLCSGVAAYAQGKPISTSCAMFELVSGHGGGLSTHSRPSANRRGGR